MDIHWLRKEILAEAGRSAFYQVCSTIFMLLGPFMGGAITAYQGIVEGLPIAYIITLSVAVFTMIAFLIIIIMFQKMVIGVADKVLIVGPKHAATAKGLPKSIVYIITLRNSSLFPMEYTVRPKYCSLGNSSDPDDQTKEISGVIESGALENVRFSAIPITNEMKGKQIEGVLEYEVEYQKLGEKKKFKKTKKHKTYVKFKNNSKVVDHFDAANVYDKLKRDDK